MVSKTYKQSLQTKVYKVKGMDCASCAQMIELDLEEAGIKAQCSFAKETLEVELTDPKQEEIVKEILTSYSSRESASKE